MKNKYKNQDFLDQKFSELMNYTGLNEIQICAVLEELSEFNEFSFYDNFDDYIYDKCVALNEKFIKTGE